MRRERLADAARLLPVAAVALVLLPDFLLSGTPAAEGATAAWLAYLFGAWLALIAATAALTRALRRAARDETSGEAEP